MGWERESKGWAEENEDEEGMKGSQMGLLGARRTAEMAKRKAHSPRRTSTLYSTHFFLSIRPVQNSRLASQNEVERGVQERVLLVDRPFERVGIGLGRERTMKAKGSTCCAS